MYYNREIKELAQEFSTDLKSGLTEQQVTENLAKYGPNELEQTKTIYYSSILFAVQRCVNDYFNYCCSCQHYC